MKIASWNVNGIIAAKQKGLISAISRINSDIFFFQEIKTLCQVNLPDYYQYWNPAKRSGYSGVMAISKIKPLSVSYGLGTDRFDREGRIICLEFSNICVIGVYVPNSTGSSARADYRAAWDSEFLAYLGRLTKPAIICGDFNVARADIDVYPENQRNQEAGIGFTSREREGFERILDSGFVDVFRQLYPNRTGCYTWWSQRLNKRSENKGWRLDYFLVLNTIADTIRNVSHETEIMGSDHCPITLEADLAPNNALPNAPVLVQEWNNIDWETAESKRLLFQQQLAKAAYSRNWERITQVQKRIARSLWCKALAVRHVSSLGTTPGIDGVKWTSDEERMNAVKSLTSRNYHAQPYRCIIIHDKGKERRIQIPTAYDKAMQVLYSYTLEPVAEAFADRKSFAFRKGRSAFDAHYYVMRMFKREDCPRWVVRCDVRGCYDHISHKWLMRNIPMDHKVLEQFLDAGFMFGGKLFPTKEGISQGVTLSTIISNMVLDGLQDYIYSGLYEYVNEIDYADGDMVRFADDIIVCCRSEERAMQVWEIVQEFLAERGLALHPEKSYITTIDEGFDFLSRWYQAEKGHVKASPSDKAVKNFEARLEKTILGFQGSQEGLINTVNRMVTGWGNYHRVAEDCDVEFRHIDTVIDGLLVKKIRQMHPTRQWGHLLKHYWYVEPDGRHVFALADNPAKRIIKLTSIPRVKHQPIYTRYNPFFDSEYYAALSQKRVVQKISNPKYKGIWLRQSGNCYFCGNPMLPGQDTMLVEKKLGDSRDVQNLAYIHRSCSQMELTEIDAPDSVDLFSLLDGVQEEEDVVSAPYIRLREYFRKREKSPVTLTFKEIESIMGDELDSHAFTDEGFWYDAQPELMRSEGVPPSLACISRAWTSQGFSILRLHLDEKRVVFTKEKANTSGLKIPAKLLNQKLPDAAIHEAKEFFAYLIKKYAL